MKTKLWTVQLLHSKQGYYIFVTNKVAKNNSVDTIQFRLISPLAAARSYIRNNLPRRLYMIEDGANIPGDLCQNNAWNGRTAKENQQYANFLVKRRMAFTRWGQIKIIVDKI